MHFELAFVLLFVIATLVAILSRRWNLPYTVALTVAGLIVGSLHLIEPPQLTKEFLFAAILPGLIFEAAYHLEFDRFRENAKVINALAIPGVAAAIGISAAILMAEVKTFEITEGFSLSHALVFGALISATDPIAVVSLFRSLGAPKRLMVLVEGESLLNDGTAVVFFTTLLAYALGQALTVGGAVIFFVTVVGVGVVVGAVVGLVVSQVTKRIDEPMIEITLTVIAAYGSFGLAEQVHASGVIATVVAGMLCGNYAAHVGMSPTTRIAVQSFWDYFAFALNSVVFLLIGFEVSTPSLLEYWPAITAAFLAVLVGRIIVVYTVSSLLARTKERLPWSWRAVLTWAGLRGAISMVLVLGLPYNFPHRDLLVHMTFGVVVLSILVQGMTMNPVLKWFGIVLGRSEHEDAYEMHHAKLLTAKAAIRELDNVAGSQSVHPPIVDALRAEYGRVTEAAEAGLREVREGQGRFSHKEALATRRRLLLAEKDELIRIYRKGVISKSVYEALTTEIDTRISRIEHSDVDDPEVSGAPQSDEAE